MKISTKGRYGLRIMVDLAQHDGDQPRMIADICKSQSLSPKYVGRLILKLRNAGMIASVRGAKGGYKIKRLPKHITLLEIIETMEGALSIVDCVACPKKCKRSEGCVAREIWGELNAKIKRDLESITLQDIINRHADIKDYCI